MSNKIIGRPRTMTPLEEMNVYSMYLEEISLAEIAYKHEISVSTVQRIVKRLAGKEEEEEKEATRRLNELMERAGANNKDSERTALFYIIAGNDDLYEKVDFIYNFKEGGIDPDCLESEKVDFSTSSNALIKLGYSLFNGFPADVFETFYSLDHENYKLAIEAINIRFNK